MYEEEIKALKEELKTMQEFAEYNGDEERAELLEIRLTTINTYMARSGRMMVEAKMYAELIKAECYDKYLDKMAVLKPSIVKDFINAKCAEANAVAKGLERLNHDFVHISDNIRTQISLEKKMMDLAIRESQY